MIVVVALTTDGQIEIDVRDDVSAQARLLTLPVSARLEALAEPNGPRYAPALERLVAADSWGQLRRDLSRAWEYQRSVLPGIRHPEKITVTLTLGDPDDPVFLERTLGYCGMGGVPGTIWLVAWPTDFNLMRIGACGVHELAHNLRTPNIEIGFNLAVWVMPEGKAEVFTVEVCGQESTGGWYRDVIGAELEAAYDKVTGAFDTGTGFQEWTPYVLGDLITERIGLRPIGVPHMGGYAVGRRIVEQYLLATGLKAAQAIVRPASDILTGADVKTRKSSLISDC